jgi:H+/Cl- antiporter ClcA
MKKIIIAVPVLAICMPVQAQNLNFGNNWSLNMEAFRMITFTIVLILFMTFILNVLKKIFEYRLKNKIVNKGIPQDVASSILQTSEGDNKNAPVKWFALLAGLGVGLTIVNYTLPLGIHSLAIMSFSIAFSFLGYFLFLKKTNS